MRNPLPRGIVPPLAAIDRSKGRGCHVPAQWFLALAALLLAVVGCAKDSSNLTANSTSAKKEETFEGSPKAVAAAAQVALELMNIPAMLSTKDNAVRLLGGTRSGNSFVMTFERRKSAEGERTAIHIDWVKNADPQFWMDFMGNMMTALDSQHGKERTASN